MDLDTMEDEYEVDNKQHQQLVSDILNLNARQYVKKPTRTEPTAQISEYDLVKSLTDVKEKISLYDLTKPLKNRAVHQELRKKVKKTETKAKTLPKPLGKPQSERIKRSVAYENTKKQLDKWDSLVTANRVSRNLTFPLKDPNFDYKEARDFTSNWVLKSNLEKELEKLEPETIEVEIDNAENKMEEMLERKKELQILKQRQSYKEIKARQQNKIKSKKFRRIARKEKMKKQMQEFELLQKTNPEEAMKKLEEIDKARAEERASLRHKSTGKWARNHQIRAKYDKESRKELAEQLVISKDLMKKQQISESGDSEDDNDITENEHYDSVWSMNANVTKEVKDFYAGLKQFSVNNLKDSGEVLKCSSTSVSNRTDKAEDIKEVNQEENMKKDIQDECLDVENGKQIPGTTKLISKNKATKRKNKTKTPIYDEKNIADKIKSSKRRKTKANIGFQVDGAAGVWEVISTNDTVIDDVFDDIEYKLENKVVEKYKKVKSKLDNKTNIPRKVNTLKLKQNKKQKTNTDNKTVANKNPIVNKETPKNANTEEVNTDIARLKAIIEAPVPAKNSKDPNSININVNLFNSPNVDNSKENIYNGEDLFMDDELVEEFMKEKVDEVQKDTPKDIDLTIPGWGSWGGVGLTIPNKKKRRFLLKMPKEMPRKDMNKGHLIINESANDNIKSHLVDNVPFPFKTVKDFEASVRAPIGNTFVPETAFRRMIKPAIRTRMGAIIEPITEDVLLKKNKKKK